MTKIKKRFVAGAHCPECQALDSILLFKENGIESVECTECGYRQQQLETEPDSVSSNDVIGIFKQ